MNKSKLASIGLSVALFMSSGGIALADHSSENSGRGGVGVGVNSSLDVETTFRGDTKASDHSAGKGKDDASVSASSGLEVEVELEHGVTTTTTKPHGGDRDADDDGVRDDDDDSSARSASSSDDRRRGHGRDDRRGIRFFFEWLFGLDDSTTVGDIKAQLEATTSADSTVEGDGQGLGLFAKGFFSSFLSIFRGTNN